MVTGAESGRPLARTFVMGKQTNRTNPSSAKPSEAKSDRAVSYNEFKEYEGQRYTGMKIGRSHKWHYDRGDWKETKITPDLWQIGYAVTKRRAGHAPEGSGVPVGTEYHWYVLAHQNVAKQTANDYTTSLTGLKFKIAHKRAGSQEWSATPRDTAQAHDHVPAKRDRRPGETERRRPGCRLAAACNIIGGPSPASSRRAAGREACSAEPARDPACEVRTLLAAPLRPIPTLVRGSWPHIPVAPGSSQVTS